MERHRSHMPARQSRRISVMLQHLESHNAEVSPLVPVPTTMLATVAPLLVLGAVSMYQQRTAQDEKPRDQSSSDLLAEDAGFDAERLRQLETWAASLIASKKLPGIVVALARKGKIVFHEAYGDAAYKKDSIMAIGSMATPMIVAAVLSLADEGLLSIDDPVSKFLPYFANFRVHRSGRSPKDFQTDPLASPITIRHLLTHTWGFPGKFYAQSGNADTRSLDAAAATLNPRIGIDADFEKLVEVPLIAQPGHSYRDSIAPSVIGHIICCITGRSLPEVVHERILGPLGMTETDWFVAAEKQHRVPSMTQAAPYLTNRLWGNSLTGEHGGHTSWLGWVAKEGQRSIPAQLPEEITDQTTVYSTAVDQLLFHSMLLTGGMSASGVRLLSPASVQLLTTDQLSGLGHNLADAKFNSHANDKANSSGKSPQFGSSSGQGSSLGMQVVIRPLTSRLAGSKGTFSSWGFGGTECWSDPALDMSVFVGTQLSPFWAMPELRQEVAGAIYGSLVSTSAAKFLASAQAEGGGAMGNMMNMMMMMSMLGGGGMMGGMPAAAGAGAGAAAAPAGGDGGAGVTS